MTDLTKLKELAELATPGRNFDRLPSAGGGLKYTCTGDDDSLVLRVDHKNGEFGFIGPKGEEDEAFFLACTPKAVLELIAEVDRLRKQVDMLINQHMPREPIPEMPGWSRVIDAERIKAENDHLRNGMKGDYDLDAWLDWAQEKGRLKAENEALRKDAERYQALRQKDRGGVVVRDRTSHLFGENLDAAIDAALEGGGR